MRITQEAHYGLRIINFLAEQDKRVDSNRIEAEILVPKRFALKILRKLTHAGITKSFSGVNGGYILRKQPDEITMREVIEAVSGDICITSCLFSDEACNLSCTETCPIHSALAKVQGSILTALDDVTFENMRKEVK